MEKKESWIPKTSVYANGSSRIHHAICDVSRAVMRQSTRKKQAKHVHTYMHTITASFSCPDSQKHWSPELHRKWLVFKWTCQPELVLSSGRLIRQSFIFCPSSVCWLHYISAWFAWKAPLCYLASVRLYSSRPGKITLRVFIKTFNKTVDC